jgi:TRAP-type mannitol/chloroaromatic compound transport system permease small subunit
MKSAVKTVIMIFGVLLILAGATWILQGVNILPGSFMTGNPQWAINGAVTVLFGAGLFWFASRKNKP